MECMSNQLSGNMMSAENLKMNSLTRNRINNRIEKSREYNVV